MRFPLNAEIGQGYETAHSRKVQNKKYKQQSQMYGQTYADRMSVPQRSKEEEALEKIRAIWLAETIRRQIAMDKEQKEAMQRKKLYQAFMQQKLNEEET